MLQFAQLRLAWASGGSPENQRVQSSLALSPLHNLKPGTSLPATMITTTDHDDRSSACPQFQVYTAAHTATHTGSAPVLIRMKQKRGMGL